MGLAIVADETMPVPRIITLTLTCDGDHGFLPPPILTFQDADYVRDMSRAIAAGWSETPERILCPDCRRARQTSSG